MPPISSHSSDTSTKTPSLADSLTTWNPTTGAVGANSQPTLNASSSICAVPVVLKRFPLEDLRELVNIPLPKTLRVLEYDNKNGGATDEEVKAFLSTNYGIIHPADLTIYEKSRRNEILKAAKRYGASIRQLSRLTSIGYSIIQKAWPR